jgi:hypothetical protein
MKTPINNFDEGYGIARCAGWRGATLVVGGLWLVVAPAPWRCPRRRADAEKLRIRLISGHTGAVTPGRLFRWPSPLRVRPSFSL